MIDNMLNLPKVILFFFAFFSINCNLKNNIEYEKPDIYWGEIGAIINGEVWRGCPYARYRRNNTSAISISGDQLNDLFLHKATLSLINLKITLEEQYLGIFGSDIQPFGLFAYLDYDVSLADYLVREDVPIKGTVTITNYNEHTRELSGVFDLVLYRDKSPGLPDAPDSLVITDGYFHTRILE